LILGVLREAQGRGFVQKLKVREVIKVKTSFSKQPPYGFGLKFPSIAISISSGPGVPPIAIGRKFVVVTSISHCPLYVFTQAAFCRP
jgi:hypothetical protein